MRWWDFHHDGHLFAEFVSGFLGVGEIWGVGDDAVACEGESQPLTYGGVF